MQSSGMLPEAMGCIDVPSNVFKFRLLTPINSAPASGLPKFGFSWISQARQAGFFARAMKACNSPAEASRRSKGSLAFAHRVS
jgi:hypothetical protein